MGKSNYDLVVEKGTPPEDVVSKIREQGLVIIPGFFTKEEVTDLDGELVPKWEKLNLQDMCTAENGTTKVGTNIYKPGKVIRVQPSSYTHFPHLLKLFVQNEFLNRVVDLYYGPHNNKFMQIFAYHDVSVRNEEWIDGITHSSALHFDPYQALKFGTYLYDTSEENGATRAIPGSHVEVKYFSQNILRETMWEGKPVLNCHEPFKLSRYSEEDAVYLNASPGDLVFFDTDCWHGGAEIKRPGLERKCILVHNRKG